jgi:hypothetical protein
MNSELVYASDFEEFFYVDDDMPVSEGQPVGVEISNEHDDARMFTEVTFILFDYIYHQINEEAIDK